VDIPQPGPWFSGVGGGSGTSASTPIVAALFNRIIEERLNAGKGPLGFVNPVLYQNPEILTDIKLGDNAVCCKGKCDPKTGFRSTPGWDPVVCLSLQSFRCNC
jgi:tripeptidyl-peptidase I